MSQEPSANKPQSLRLRFEFYNLAKKKKRGGELVIQMHHEMKEILIICLEEKREDKRREWKDKTYIVFFFFERESFNLWLNQTKTLIGFWCKWGLNSRSLI